MLFEQVIGRLYDCVLEKRISKKFKRFGWKNVSHIAVQWPDSGSANTRPYIYGIDPTGLRVPWLASQVDLFADDWEEVQ